MALLTLAQITKAIASEIELAYGKLDNDALRANTAEEIAYVRGTLRAYEKVLEMLGQEKVMKVEVKPL